MRGEGIEKGPGRTNPPSLRYCELTSEMDEWCPWHQNVLVLGDLKPLFVRVSQRPRNVPFSVHWM